MRKGWVQSSFAPQCEKKIKVGPKREECEKGGGCEVVSHLGAKKNVPTFVKSCVCPCPTTKLSGSTNLGLGVALLFSQDLNTYSFELWKHADELLVKFSR